MGYRQPKISVDIIIHHKGKIVIVKRKNPPFGWCLPGGFVDYGETLEQAAVREAKEETNLEVELIRQFHAYSDPNRDPRFHSITVAYLAKGKGEMKAGDDATDIKLISLEDVPILVAGHKEILEDYKNRKY